MKILICDDELEMVRLETSLLKTYCQENNLTTVFCTFTDPSQASNEDKVDIALLDIDMGKLNGIDLARNQTHNEYAEGYISLEKSSFYTFFSKSIQKQNQAYCFNRGITKA